MMTDQKKSSARERPICIAVILCNETIEDKRTNNKTLINLFNNIAAPQLPASQPRLVAMASLTNGIGEWPITFIIRSPSDQPIVRFEGKAQFDNPLTVMDIVIQFNGIVFTEEGVHFVDVLTGDYPLGHRRFTVQVAPAGGGASSPTTPPPARRQPLPP